MSFMKCLDERLVQSARPTKVAFNQNNLFNGSELVNHASRVGVRLQSKGLFNTPSPNHRARPKTVSLYPLKRMPTSREYLPLSAWERPFQGLHPDFVQDAVVPVRSPKIVKNNEIVIFICYFFAVLAARSR